MIEEESTTDRGTLVTTPRNLKPARGSPHAIAVFASYSTSAPVIEAFLNGVYGHLLYLVRMFIEINA